MKLKKLLALSMTAALGLSLVGCGDGGNTTDGGNDTTPEATEAGDNEEAGNEGGESSGDLTYGSITLGEDYTDITTTIKWLHHKTDREEDGTIADLVARFNEVYPNITVETEGVTDYAEDSLLRLSTGDWGDIMFIPAIDKQDLSNYFIPYGTTSEMDQYINFANSWENEGMCYGIGYMANAQGVLYNKKVFEDAGITSMPATPDEFIDALKAIKEKTDAIPLYTNYAAEWTMGAWDAYIGCVSHGDAAYLNQKFVHDADPFSDKGDGTGLYALYKILYDAVAEGLIEEDYTTTDWESCKAMINNGEIGTMVLGSWAIAQMKAAGDHPDDIGYMPFPITVNGTQYALAGPDYSYAISKDVSEDNQKASMVFVKWLVEESGWCEFEGGYPVSKTAETSFDFSSATILSDEQALAGEEDYLNEMNAESELSFNAGGNQKIMAIVEAAFTGSKTYDEIMAEWKQKWNDAQAACGINAE
ncbi:MAG: ABC transporter substrate-binding protein [Lachnospiraceae bacterium]|nr:ABC transporter substrate-binding protein [Lachnospiraceae bacterium]